MAGELVAQVSGRAFDHRPRSRFLDNTVNRVLHLSGEDAHVYRGNYAFERLRGEKLERQQATAAKQQAQIAHIQQFVDRFCAQASKAKQKTGQSTGEDALTGNTSC